MTKRGAVVAPEDGVKTLTSTGDEVVASAIMTADPGILSSSLLLTTIGSWSLIFLAAFESLAVTTIMPLVTADLHGQALYSLAFSATLAAGVVGMVVSGSWADRVGPTRPLGAAIVLFAIGLAVAGTAPTMTVFVAGRFVQGLGAGGITVALYVLIAKVYPAALHIRIFGAFASAWVLPSLVGPFVAGLIAEALSWHWVFLGVVVLVAVAAAMIAPALPRREKTITTESPRRGRVVAAAVVALAVVALGSSAVVAPFAIVAIGFAARGLLPAGTYRARPGLPAAVLLCAAAGGVFFGTEVYLPLLLHDRYGLPAWLSGLTLTAAAIAWACASAIQSRRGDRPPALRGGAVLLAAGAFTELLVAAAGLGPVPATVGWVLAGAGMGTLYPQVSTLVLAQSEPGREGFNTAAKSIADSIGGSVALAVAGLLFGALGDSTRQAPYVGVLIFMSAVGVTVVLVAGRAGALRLGRGARQA
jgi:MFS family permease